MTYAGIFITLAFLMILLTFLITFAFSLENRITRKGKRETPENSEEPRQDSCYGETLQGLL